MEDQNNHDTQDSKATNIDTVTEQQKGSDADADRNDFNDDLPTPEEAAEQIKGSDADYDQGTPS